MESVSLWLMVEWLVTRNSHIICWRSCNQIIYFEFLKVSYLNPVITKEKLKCDTNWLLANRTGRGVVSISRSSSDVSSDRFREMRSQRGLSSPKLYHYDSITYPVNKLGVGSDLPAIAFCVLYKYSSSVVFAYGGYVRTCIRQWWSKLYGPNDQPKICMETRVLEWDEV